MHGKSGVQCLRPVFSPGERGKGNRGERPAFGGSQRPYPLQELEAVDVRHSDIAHQHMRLLDEHFEKGGQFVTGEFFTLADVVLGLSTQRWLLTPMDKPHLDALHGYY